MAVDVMPGVASEARIDLRAVPIPTVASLWWPKGDELTVGWEISHFSEPPSKITVSVALEFADAPLGTAIAEADTTVLLLSREAMAKMAVDHPAVCVKIVYRFAKLLSQWLRRTSGELVEVLGSRDKN